MAYIAFPLVLHVLNLHLSSASATTSPNTLIDVLRTMHPQYDGVDWVARLVRYLVDLVHQDPAFATGPAKVADWAELLVVNPTTYLRLALLMDLSMSTGRIPDRKSFLARLEGLRRRGSMTKQLHQPQRLVMDISEKAVPSLGGTASLAAEQTKQQQDSDAEAAMREFMSLPDLEDLFDPSSLADLEVGDGGEESWNGLSVVDLDASLLVNQEALQV